MSERDQCPTSPPTPYQGASLPGVPLSPHGFGRGIDRAGRRVSAGLSSAPRRLRGPRARPRHPLSAQPPSIPPSRQHAEALSRKARPKPTPASRRSWSSTAAASPTSRKPTSIASAPLPNRRSTRLRAYAVQNGDGTAFYLKPLFEREKKPKPPAARKARRPEPPAPRPPRLRPPPKTLRNDWMPSRRTLLPAGHGVG